jgi:hypothetical protein
MTCQRCYWHCSEGERGKKTGKKGEKDERDKRRRRAEIGKELQQKGLEMMNYNIEFRREKKRREKCAFLKLFRTCLCLPSNYCVGGRDHHDRNEKGCPIHPPLPHFPQPRWV